MKRPRVCHTDVPSTETHDDAAFLREAAFESTGFHQGQHIEQSRAELERRGGPESVIRDAVKRIERGGR